MTEVGEGLGGGDRYGRSPPPAITPSAKRFSYQDGRGRNSLGGLNDLATRRVTTARFAEPLTPPLTVERNKSQHQQHGRSTSSPTLSFSPRAFYHIGIGSASPLTPVKRQFQSPYLISRRRTLVGGQSRLSHTRTDENVNINADTDTKCDMPSGEEEPGTSALEGKGDEENDDGDDDGGEDGGEVAEHQDEFNDTTESFELIDVYEGDSTYDFKDETGDAFEDETSHGLKDGTTDGFQDITMGGLQDETTDGFKDGTIDGFHDDTTDGFKDGTIDGFKDETGDSFANPLKSPSLDNMLPSPGSGSVELVHESRERLIVRLNGLIQRISELPDEDELGNDNHPSLGALHIQVYEMEKILPPSEDTKSSLSSLSSNKSTSSKTPRLVPLQGGNSVAPKESTEPPKFWGSHTITVPNWLGSRFSEALLAPSPMLSGTRAQELSGTIKATTTVTTVTAATATNLAPPRAHSPAPTSSPSIRIGPPSEPALVSKSTQTIDQDAAKFSQIASETNKLTGQLEAVFKSLQARREESAHLHYLLVERAEAAAGRILELEKDVADLQEELGDNEGELKHLRLRMRAVETLCGEFVRCNAKRGGVIDPELVESIETWKSDWAKLREKMAAKKNEKRKARRSDSGLGGMEVQDSATASTVTMSSLGLNSPEFSRTGRESGATTPTITTPIRTIHRRRQ